jgi:hypothetical protein
MAMTNDSKTPEGKKKQTLEDKLETMKQQHRKRENQIKAQIKAEEAREKAKQRKIDTRKKIIIGALAQTHMEKNPHSDFAKKLAQLIDEYVIKDTERSYFDLPPIPKRTTTPTAPEIQKTTPEQETISTEENREATALSGFFRKK